MREKTWLVVFGSLKMRKRIGGVLGEYAILFRNTDINFSCKEYLSMNCWCEV
jgi:hypothetical protein